MIKKATEEQTKGKTRQYREFEGTVISNTEEKTIHVEVKSKKLHSKYNKFFSVSKKFAVHDEKKEANVGDLVGFRECRPISKTKKWYLVKVIKKAE